MRRHSPKVTYTVVNPNEPREIRKLLKTLIVEKLTAVKRGR